VITGVDVQYKDDDADSVRVLNPMIEAIYVYVDRTERFNKDRTSSETVELVAGRVMANYDADGELIGVEVLG
jgi:hypothetical protein